MAQYLPFNVKLEELNDSETTAAPQHKPPPPQYTGRRNSALAVARRASMADVLANNARRSGSLGDVLLNASNSAASSLQLYLHSLIQRQGSASSSAAHDLVHHVTEESSSSSSSSKKSSKRKRKEGKEAKRARKNKSAQEEDADTAASRKNSKKKPRRSSMSAVSSSPRDHGMSPPSASGRTPGADSECMPFGGSPGAPPMAASHSALSPSSYPSASSSPSMTAAAAAYPQAHTNGGYHMHPAHSQPFQGGGGGGQPHQHQQTSGAFTSFDECFDTDLAILSTLSADEVELSPTPLSSSPQPPPAQIGVTAASMQHAYPAAHSHAVPSSRPTPHHPHHQQQAYQHPMCPPAQPTQMHAQQATPYPTSTGYMPQHQGHHHHHHQPQPLSPPTYHQQQQHTQYAYPSPVPSPSMTDDWSGLSSLFPQEASWQPRSPALSMHEQVERLLFNAPPPASPSSGASVLSPVAAAHHAEFLRPHDIPRVHPVPSPLPVGVAACDEGTIMPAASPLSTFFDWADELLAFDPTKQGPTTSASSSTL